MAPCTFWGSGDAFALLALGVIGLPAAVAVGAIVLFDTVLRAAHQVLRHRARTLVSAPKEIEQQHPSDG